MPFPDAPVGSAVQPCPRLEPEPTHWIEIELVGEDDEPIPWEEYAVVLPWQETVTGYLDGDGFARLQGLKSGGQCMVCFPRLDKEAWEKIATLPEKAGT